MAKKAPAKSRPTAKAVPAKKVTAKKPAPAAKKVAAKPATKLAPKKGTAPAPKSLKDSVLKAAGKLVAKVTAPPKLSPKELAKAKEKEKALAAKAKAQAEADKKKQKELEKKKKEDEKLRLKKEKEALKAAKKADKGKAKTKKKSSDDDEDFDDEDEDFEDDELLLDEEETEEEEKPRRASDEDEDFDEFEEDYKKAKATKKSGKKAYEEDADVDLYQGPKGGKKYTNAMMADLEGKIADEIAELREHFNWKDIAGAIGSMDFFIDPKNDECIEKGCDNIRTTQSYCRLHYLRNWKTIQKKRDILQEGKLQEYIEELISKYPPKFIEALLSDLSDDKEFYRVLNELNITSEFDFEEDEFENAVDDDDADDDLGIETISSSLRYEDE